MAGMPRREGTSAEADHTINGKTVTESSAQFITTLKTQQTMDPLHIAERFANALDGEDYAVAESLLDVECEYLCRGELYRGPSQIIETYRGNGELAKRFDAIEYGSQVVAKRNGQFRLEFADHLTHAGHRLTFRCEQIIDVNQSGRIVRIEHLDLPGQREALAEFKALLE